VKLALDENLPASAAARLAALGYDVHTVAGTFDSIVCGPGGGAVDQ
jgi:hypothetical protein